MDGLRDACKVPIQLATGCIISLALRKGHAGAGPSSPHNSPVSHWPRLVPKFSPKFHYAKRRFPITSKCRQIHGVLNVDEIIN
jgi:hypothetical protein